jgi:hypothetical protein
MGEAKAMDAGNRYMTIFSILILRFIMIFLHAEKSNYPEILEKAIAQAG